MKEKIYKLDLALQGGGAHGAFTWGVLDRLLEEPDIDFTGISGTSAGAMNGAALLSGLITGGRDGARKTLRQFWERVADIGAFLSPFQQSPMEQMAEHFNLDKSFGYNMFDMMSRVWSPYQLNPLNLNPLRSILLDTLDFRALQTAKTKQLFVTATSVHTGQARVFTCADITVDALLASACIPFLFQAVEIDGEPYWDGGYMGNPVIWPLIYNTPVDDVMLIQINPIARESTPKTASEIINRLNEITFNSSLVAEMRAINFVSRLIREEKLDTKKYKDVRMHRIAAPDAVHDLNASSKMNTTDKFFTFLFDHGRKSADEWLVKNKSKIGREQTSDIRQIFLNKKPLLTKGK